MRLLNTIYIFLISLAKKIGNWLIGESSRRNSPPSIDELEEPIIDFARDDRQLLQRAAGQPGHTLTGPAYIANQLICYAMASDDRRPFMSLRGVSPGYVGWLKTLGVDDLDRLASSTHEKVWDHMNGEKLIPGLPSYMKQSAAYWVRAGHAANSPKQDEQQSEEQAPLAPAPSSIEPQTLQSPQVA